MTDAKEGRGHGGAGGEDTPGTECTLGHGVGREGREGGREERGEEREGYMRALPSPSKMY